MTAGGGRRGYRLSCNAGSTRATAGPRLARLAGHERGQLGKNGVQEECKSAANHDCRQQYEPGDHAPKREKNGLRGHVARINLPASEILELDNSFMKSSRQICCPELSNTRNTLNC